MIMKGIVQIPIIPLRRERSHSSEMVSQLLFGETYSINDIDGDWVFVTTDYDNYSGWISHNQLSINNYDDSKTVVANKYIEITDKEDNRMIISSGSMITSSNNDIFILNGKEYRIVSRHSSNNNTNVTLSVVSNAKQYIGSPYLWGGKSFMGFDCSGFVQTMFKINGVKLPRDASQQVENGKSISSIKEAQEDDLAFFGDGKRITHVGIIIDNEHIIHCSGQVKIDKIDDEGIISDGKYTHKLTTIRRLSLE